MSTPVGGADHSPVRSRYQDRTIRGEAKGAKLLVETGVDCAVAGNPARLSSRPSTTIDENRSVRHYLSLRSFANSLSSAARSK